MGGASEAGARDVMEERGSEGVKGVATEEHMMPLECLPGSSSIGVTDGPLREWGEPACDREEDGWLHVDWGKTSSRECGSACEKSVCESRGTGERDSREPLGTIWPCNITPGMMLSIASIDCSPTLH